MGIAFEKILRKKLALQSEAVLRQVVKTGK